MASCNSLLRVERYQLYELSIYWSIASSPAYAWVSYIERLGYNLWSCIHQQVYAYTCGYHKIILWNFPHLPITSSGFLFMTTHSFHYIIWLSRHHHMQSGLPVEISPSKGAGKQCFLMDVAMAKLHTIIVPWWARLHTGVEFQLIYIYILREHWNCISWSRNSLANPSLQ